MTHFGNKIYRFGYVNSRIGLLLRKRQKKKKNIWRTPTRVEVPTSPKEWIFGNMCLVEMRKDNMDIVLFFSWLRVFSRNQISNFDLK